MDNVSCSEFAAPPGNTSEQGFGETPTAVGNTNVLMLYDERKYRDRIWTSKKVHN